MNAYAAAGMNIRLTVRGLETRVSAEIGKGLVLTCVDPGHDIEALAEGLPKSLYAVAAAVYGHWPKEGKDAETGSPRELPFPPARSIANLLRLCEVLDLFPTVTAPIYADPFPAEIEPNPFD